VIFLVGPQNVRSQKAVEKLGAIREGPTREVRGHEAAVYRIAAPA